MAPGARFLQQYVVQVVNNKNLIFSSNIVLSSFSLFFLFSLYSGESGFLWQCGEGFCIVKVVLNLFDCHLLEVSAVTQVIIR